VLSFRPKTNHAKTKGLYFVGASTHPGTGVPIVLAGSKIVAEQVLKSVGGEVPWKDGEFRTKRTGRAIDQMIEGEGFGWVSVVVLIAFTALVVVFMQLEE
jgi:phytoene desaturase (3,4-didehydrolycopene-forming)